MTDHNEEIGYQYQRIRHGIVEKLVDGRRYNMQQRDDGQWYFNHQKNRDHDNQHERGAVGFAQLLAFALAILAEQRLASILRLAHGSHEQHIEADEQNARNEMDEEQAEQEIRAKVEVLADCCADPVGGANVINGNGDVVDGERNWFVRSAPQKRRHAFVCKKVYKTHEINKTYLSKNLVI